jgi:hypothetical protein
MAQWAPAKNKRRGQSTILAVGEAASVVTRVAAAFIAITCAVVLGGLAYYAATRRGIGLGSVPAYFLRLSSQQIVALLFGVVVAFALIASASVAIQRGEGGESRLGPGRFLQKMAVVVVLLFYVWGARCAYNVSRSIARSPDWAPIHALYSWAYVGFTFSGWVSEHPHQPVGKTMKQFWGLTRR